MSEFEEAGSLTIREAAREAERTPETVRRWVWSGRLPARKEGNRLMVARDDLERVAGSALTSGLGSWRDQLVAQKAKERAKRPRSAVDLVVSDRSRRSAG